MDIFGSITGIVSNFAKFALVTAFCSFICIYLIFPMVQMFVPFLMMLFPFDGWAFVPHIMSAVAFLLGLWLVGHLLN